MDTWAGNTGRPITLNKYLYANADQVMYADPSGYFGFSTLGGSVRGALSTIAHASYRFGARVATKGVKSLKKSLKKREWAIYRVKLARGFSLSHEFIWAKNIRTKKGIGYHVGADPREALRSARTGTFVDGTFTIAPENKVNEVGGRKLNVVSKKLVTRLSKFGFSLWNMSTAGFMKEGDSCTFSYNIPNANCITWTEKAEKKAKKWALFPL